MTIYHHGDYHEMRQRRLATKKLVKEIKQERHWRFRKKGAREDVELANIFREFGIDYLNMPHQKAFQMVRDRMEIRRADSISTKAMDFLTDNFDAYVKSDGEGRSVIRFPVVESYNQEKGEEKPMRLYSQLAGKSGTTRKIVRGVYEALINEVKEQLEEQRFIRLPELVRLKISYRPAREKHRGINPFTKKKIWINARPASNKLRFAPAKSLKDYVRDEIEVVEPKKKLKVKKVKKHRR